MIGLQIRGAVRENEIAAVLAVLAGRPGEQQAGGVSRWRAIRRAALAKGGRR